jgi:hypothetical protein
MSKCCKQLSEMPKSRLDAKTETNSCGWMGPLTSDAPCSAALSAISDTACSLGGGPLGRRGLRAFAGVSERVLAGDPTGGGSDALDLLFRDLVFGTVRTLLLLAWAGLVSLLFLVMCTDASIPQARTGSPKQDSKCWLGHVSEPTSMHQ